MSDEPRSDPAEAKAFRTMKGRSVLDAFKSVAGDGGSIHVRGAEEDPYPVTVKRSVEGVAAADSRYEIVGEIARGGIGIVYRGRDKDINRDIAIKVLREEYVQRQDVVQRFVEEAQVGGQLQHPGIVPIYGLGLQADGRPSFAMKLIKGLTLAELLESNPRGIDLVAVFEQIAQTMAYSHSRRVIHRDLKPANVMIGAFGEVQVVDWGFAKVLGQDEAVQAPERSVIATVRSGKEGSHSLVGSVMGTPAYMPPEQAMGNIAELDERCDVFSLGAILCEILTGKAPYTGAPMDRLIAATQCRLEPAHERLNAADAPAGLKQIVRDCLQPLPADRPKNARVVAERLSGYLASVQERAHQAELEALASETRATRERVARKRALARAGIGLLAILAGGGGYFYWKRERDERVARAVPSVQAALREAIRHEGAEEWRAAAASAQRAADIAAAEGVEDGGARAMFAAIERRRDEAERAARLREEDDALLAELVAIRNLAPGSTPIGSRAPATGRPAAWEHPGDRYKAMDAAYAAAFEKRFGSLAASASRLKASRHAADLAANLGFWCQLRKTTDALKGTDWAVLDALAREVDPSNQDIRAALLAGDADALHSAVARRGDMLPLALVSQVAETLIRTGRPEDAIAFLLPWNRRHPDEMMMHIRIAEAARQMAVADGKSERLEVAVRHATAAVALRPEVDLGWYHLGLCLASNAEFERAISAYQRVIELTPGYLEAYDQLAQAQLLAGRPEEALAVAERALGVSPKDAGLRLRKAALLSDHLRRHDEAVAIFREVIEQSPDAWQARTGLALAQARSGALAAARASLQQVLAVDSGSAALHVEAARVFFELGDLGSAIEHGQRAVAIDPSHRGAHLNLGFALEKQGEIEKAMTAYRAAIKLSPGGLAPYLRLSAILLRRGEAQAALDCAEEAVAGSPRSADAQASLAAALLGTGNLPAALAAAKQGIELDPRLALAHSQMGLVLAAERKFGPALEACRKAIELDATSPGAQRTIALVHAARGDRAAALAAYERAMALDSKAPDRALHRLMGRAQLYEALKDWPAAASAYEEAATLDPQSRLAYAKLGLTRLRTEDRAGAVSALARAAELGKDDPQAQALLGYAHWLKGDVDLAEAALVKALDGGATDGFVLGLYGEVQLKQGRPEKAVGALQRAVDASGEPAFCPTCHWHHPPDQSLRLQFLLGEACARTGRIEEAVAAYQEYLNASPAFAPAFTGLAQVHAERGEGPTAVAMYRKAVELDPKQAAVRARFGLLLAREGELEQAVRELSQASEADSAHAAALAEVRQQSELRPRLEAALAGKDKPKDAREALAFARLARAGREFDGSARLFAEALRRDPSLAAEPKQRLFFEAACAAARAGQAGAAQALAWLRSDLEACENLVGTERAYLRQSLPYLKVHADLEPVREAEGLSADWVKYWASVDALIERLREAE